MHRAATTTPGQVLISGIQWPLSSPITRGAARREPVGLVKLHEQGTAGHRTPLAPLRGPVRVRAYRTRSVSLCLIYPRNGTPLGIWRGAGI